MLTVIETPTFQKQADKVWTTAELHTFIDWIAKNPRAGDVIPDADGLARALNVIPGVVEHGLFIGLAKAVIVADEAGVEVIGDLA